VAGPGDISLPTQRTKKLLQRVLRILPLAGAIITANAEAEVLVENIGALAPE
jgi:hypothetical protein